MISLTVKLIFIGCIVNLARSQEGSNYGVIYGENAEDASQSASFCMMYNPRFRLIPEDKQDAPRYPLADYSDTVLCEEPANGTDFTGSAVAVARGNCTFSQKAELVQRYHGEVALVVSKIEMSEPIANSSSDYQSINVTVAIMENTDFQQLKGLGEQVTVQLYAPAMPHMDYNMVLIWAMAVFTILIGGYWSGHVRYRQHMRKIIRRRQVARGQDAPAESKTQEPEDEQETFDASPTIIVIFVFLMCGMLVALYFYYDYLVYVIIALFCVAASTALYSCVKPLMLLIPFCQDLAIPMEGVPCVRSRVEVRRLILGLICLGIGVWWAVERNASYAWIVQDILGITFCVHMMKTVRLPNLKVCTILLSLLFFYDIFFVFITPLITKSGQSVMVDVATGAGSSTREMLPMVLKVPRFSSRSLTVCSLPFSLLGFGDILVPGLLVAFLHGFDLLSHSSGIYFIGSVIGYGIGLLVTFVALALMGTGQPALLYLVPCTLITTLVIGACRRELTCLWRGDVPQKKAAPASPNVNTPKRTVPRSGSVDASDMNVEVSSVSSDNEQRALIR